MNLLVRHHILASAFVLFGTTICLAGVVEVESGTAIFTATTNVPRVKELSGSTPSYRVEGDGIVKLSEYGIAAPSQFGVKPADEVKLHLDFSAKAKPSVSAKTEGGR